MTVLTVFKNNQTMSVRTTNGMIIVIPYVIYLNIIECTYVDDRKR